MKEKEYGHKKSIRIYPADRIAIADTREFMQYPLRETAGDMAEGAV